MTVSGARVTASDRGVVKRLLEGWTAPKTAAIFSLVP